VPDWLDQNWPCSTSSRNPLALLRLPDGSTAAPRLQPFQTRRITKCVRSPSTTVSTMSVWHTRADRRRDADPGGLAVYDYRSAWITTCPWKTDSQPVEPLCPT